MRVKSQLWEVKKYNKRRKQKKNAFGLKSCPSQPVERRREQEEEERRKKRKKKEEKRFKNQVCLCLRINCMGFLGLGYGD